MQKQGAQTGCVLQGGGKPKGNDRRSNEDKDGFVRSLPGEEKENLSLTKKDRTLLIKQ